MGIRRIVPFFALALAAGCAHAPRREIAAPAAALRCEEAGVLLARRARTQPLDELRLVLTAPLAYAAAGAGWITDGALVVTVAGGGGLLVCAPLAMLEGATHGDGELTGSCFASVAGAVLGAGPPGVELAREVRAVASCHATRGAPGDTEAARVQLVQLRSDRGIWECLPAEERREVEDALAALGAPP